MFAYIIFFIILFNFAFASLHINNDSVIIDKNILSWSEIKDSNLTRQKHDYSCGSASLSTILTYYYNYEASESDILNWVLEKRGISMEDRERLEKMQLDDKSKEEVSLSFMDLAQYAESNGFKAIGLALDLESLSKLKSPVIVYVGVRDIDHFSVYKGMDKNFVYLADPSFGNIKVKIAKFKEMFYQRGIAKYPGKLLAIIPNKKDIKINDKFMQTNQHIQFIIETIKYQIR